MIPAGQRCRLKGRYRGMRHAMAFAAPLPRLCSGLATVSPLLNRGGQGIRSPAGALWMKGCYAETM